MRKKLPLLLTTLVVFTGLVSGQKNEFIFNINSGHFHYTGKDASYFIPNFTASYTPMPSTGYISPGNKPGFSYEFSVTGQRITKGKIIYGIDLAYQLFESKTGVFDPYSPISSYYAPSTVSGQHRSEFLTVTPTLGYRLIDKRFRLDLKAGFELATCIAINEQYKTVLIMTGQELNFKNELKSRRPDNRVRFQLTGFYKRFLLNAGYSLGLTNYYPKEKGGKPEAFSRFLRLGAGFRIL